MKISTGNWRNKELH